MPGGLPPSLVPNLGQARDPPPHTACSGLAAWHAARLCGGVFVNQAAVRLVLLIVVDCAVIARARTHFCHPPGQLPLSLCMRLF